MVLFFKKELLPFALLALCCGLTACGKIGDPSPPGPPDQIIYPKLYPTR